jgi:hypothetical protein
LLALPKYTVFEIRISAANSAGRVSAVSSIISASTLANPPNPLPPPAISHMGGALVLSWHALLDLQEAGGMRNKHYCLYAFFAKMLHIR